MKAGHWLLRAASKLNHAKPIPEDTVLAGDTSANWSTASPIAAVRKQILQSCFRANRCAKSKLSELEVEYACELPENDARTRMMIPLRLEGSRALVAMADPTTTTPCNISRSR